MKMILINYMCCWSLFFAGQVVAQTGLTTKPNSKTICEGSGLTLMYIENYQGLEVNEEIAVPVVDAGSFNEQEFLAAFSKITTNNPIKSRPVVLIRLIRHTSGNVSALNELLINNGFGEEFECRVTSRELDLFRNQKDLEQEEAKRSMSATPSYNKALKAFATLTRTQKCWAFLRRLA